MTSTPMVSTTAPHPEGYSQDDGNPNVWWGTSIERDEYNLHPAWTPEDGHRLLVEVGEVTKEGAKAMAADLAGWCGPS
ncbi:hypothetical protein [Arthrobacter agilis]|uniref:hypothetical protein n=1 Tax=Arthrobacter agilis TaxID=37921 RepID=UPI0027D8E84B|nr:hypothetical protein [Arthrobacter agilis]